jgi:Zn-dependent M28 family amino/carboxypeptidase
VRIRSLICFLLLLLPVTAAAQPGSLPYPPADLLNRIRPEGIRAHMNFLADDLLEGRATGTRGFMLAAKYVASQFEEMGLKPAGDNGTYFQNVHFRRIETLADKCTLSLTRDGKEQSLVWEKDFVTSGNAVRTDTSVSAPVVFVGYGITAPEFHYDDFAAIDVKGKIVLELIGAPTAFPDAPRAYYSDFAVRTRMAADHGAVGVLAIWVGSYADRTPFERLVRFFHEPNMHWLNSQGVPNDTFPEIRGGAVLTSAVASTLFAGAAKSLQQALDDAAAGKSQAFPLPVTASIRQGARFTEVESPNIAAILPGSDPQLKAEYVVYTAHADHLGIGEPINGDTLYNGAVDNASGTSGVLEIARAFSSMHTPPRRSILFVIVTGEEEGLLGSDAYASAPTVPIRQIVANLNMDEISLFYDFRDIVALGVEHSSLNREVEDVARHMGLEVSPDPMPDEGFFVRSDQFSFVKQGVPAVAIAEGYKTVDPNLNGKDISLKWEATIYHSPQDDMKQPLDFNAAVKCARVNLAVGYEVAQEDARPRWNPHDFFVEKFGAK